MCFNPPKRNLNLISSIHLIKHFIRFNPPKRNLNYVVRVIANKIRKAFQSTKEEFKLLGARF